ncbi:MAG: hypothetical protein KKE11_03720 [Gammaproteobacteria bacterium]|nr:hypothetical protein [Gammaproteobacteria bacterium]
MTKRHLSSYLVITFLFLTLSNTVFGNNQQVYLLKNISIQKLQGLKTRNPGSWNNHINDLLANQNLIEVTPELAREEFNIEWMDNYDTSLKESRAANQIEINSLTYSFSNPTHSQPAHPDQQQLPRLLIVNMGEEVGYGLFALDDIEESHMITEYTGELISDDNTYQRIQNRTYIICPYCEIESGFLAIDSRKSGGASRFVQHLPEQQTIERYFFRENLNPTDIATANSLPYTTQNGRIFLQATRRINALEQIGTEYWPRYPWEIQPHLFYHTGNIILRGLYDSPQNSPSIRIAPMLPNITTIENTTQDESQASIYYLPAFLDSI